ncbi:MAG: hypothetical protein KKD69_07185 [Euryarchaeota archaeon]|nr:hypothetical protein [Euryarchaeota archaeon]MCG2727808.1 hypothetical protein [Candidatus Methanoperedenaceae archaeon]
MPRSAELERECQQYKEKTQEENQRIVENELEKIALLKNELQDKENSMLAERRKYSRERTSTMQRLVNICMS